MPSAPASLLLLLLPAVALAATPKDEVTSLPGLKGALSSKQYSGYLDAGKGKHLHYWLVRGLLPF